MLLRKAVLSVEKHACLGCSYKLVDLPVIIHRDNPDFAEATQIDDDTLTAKCFDCKSLLNRTVLEVLLDNVEL